jgi:hypothetical protein
MHEEPIVVFRLFSTYDQRHIGGKAERRDRHGWSDCRRHDEHAQEGNARCKAISLEGQFGPSKACRSASRCLVANCKPVFEVKRRRNRPSTLTRPVGYHIQGCSKWDGEKLTGVGISSETIVYDVVGVIAGEKALGNIHSPKILFFAAKQYFHSPNRPPSRSRRRLVMCSSSSSLFPESFKEEGKRELLQDRATMKYRRPASPAVIGVASAG